MSVKQLIGPANRAFTSNGFPAPGATVSLYLSGTLTPANFYADDGLVTSLGPTLTANGAGRFETPAYQDEFTAFRIIYRDAAGVQLDDIDPFFFGYEGPRGPQGIQGDVSKVLTRTALAAIAVGGQAYGLVRYLVESGYEGAFIWNPADLSANVADDPGQFDYVPPGSGQGLATDGTDGAWVRANVVSIKTRDQLAVMPKSGVFVFDGSVWTFDTSDLSAKVTADTTQAVYVAPTSDTSGASGAWVRQLNGPLNVKWFGAVGDDTTNDGPAFQAALDFIFATRLTAAFGYAWGGFALFIPKGRYYLGTTTLNIYSSIHLFGEGSGYLSASSVLRWAANTDGIIVHSAATSGATGSTPTGPASGTIISGLGLIGGYSASSGDYMGVRLRGVAVLRDLGIRQFQGDGIYGYCAAGSGGALEGNCNASRIEFVYVEQCRNGIWFQGADANACTIIGANCSSNRAVGIYEASFLGNFYYGCHTASNAGGAYIMDRAQLSNASLFSGCYSESDQPASVFAPRAVVVGGFHAAGGAGGGIYNASDDKVNLSRTAITDTLDVAGTATFDVAAVFNQGFGIPSKYSVDANGNIISFGTTGIFLNGAGAHLSIGGSQVVGAQQGGTAPDANDLASVIALANGLKAQLRAHGLIL